METKKVSELNIIAGSDIANNDMIPLLDVSVGELKRAAREDIELVGPQGIQGIQGIQGETGPMGTIYTWRNGNGAPSNGTGIDGDFYLNDLNGDVYKRSSGAYSIVANILGPQGTQGIQGIQGVQGVPGSTDTATNIHAATSKSTPVDADELGLLDSAASWVLKKFTIANLKSILKTYFDNLTTTLTNKTIESPIIKNYDGWEITDGTWSATNANTISVATTDLTGILQKGDKIKVTNNSVVKYFYISSKPVFSTNTTFNVAGEVDLVSTGGGVITSPYYSKIDNPQGFKKGEIWYKARAFLGSNQNLTDNVTVKLNIDTETHDPNLNFDTSNKKYVIPVTGYYRVYIQGRLSSSSGKLLDVQLMIYVNGSQLTLGFNTILSGTAGGFYNGYIDNCIEVQLTKNDYLEFYAKGHTTDASIPVAVAGDCTLTVQFVSV